MVIREPPRAFAPLSPHPDDRAAVDATTFAPQAKNVEPSLPTWRSMVDVWSLEETGNEARLDRIFGSIERRGWQPDRAVRLHVGMAYARSKAWPKAMAWFEPAVSRGSCGRGFSRNSCCFCSDLEPPSRSEVFGAPISRDRCRWLPCRQDKSCQTPNLKASPNAQARLETGSLIHASFG